MERKDQTSLGQDAADQCDKVYPIAKKMMEVNNIRLDEAKKVKKRIHDHWRRGFVPLT